MKQKPRKPAIPRTEVETTRHAVIELLREHTLSAKELSAKIRMPEKEVCGHLEHIRRSIHATGEILEVSPAQCRRCGFLFTKRDRLTVPGKCPVCRHEAVAEPLFCIRQQE